MAPVIHPGTTLPRMSHPADLDTLAAQLADAWVPSDWKAALTDLVAEVRWLRGLGERALLELQFPVEDGIERAALIRHLRDLTRREG